MLEKKQKKLQPHIANTNKINYEKRRQTKEGLTPQPINTTHLGWILRVRLVHKWDKTEQNKTKQNII